MEKQKKFKFSDLKKTKIIPSDSHLLRKDSIDNKTISIDEFKKASSDKIGERRVVCNNPVWVAFAQKSNLIFSFGEDERLYQTSPNNKIINSWSIDIDSEGNIQKYDNEIITLNKEEKNKKEKEIIINEEEKIMANEKLTGLGAGVNLDDEVNKILNSEGEGAADTKIESEIKSSGSFNNTSSESTRHKLTKEEKQEIAKQREEGLSQDVQNIKLGTVSPLQHFNRAKGSLVAFLVANDPRIIAAKRKVALKDQNGKVTLKPEYAGDAALVAAVNNKESVPISKLLTVPSLVLKQSAPATPKGGVICIPRGGLTTPNKLQDSNLTFDDTNLTEVYLPLNKEDLIKFIILYFGGRIKEDSRVVTTPRELIADLKTTYSSKKKMNVTKHFIKPAVKGKLITSENSFPQKVTKTVKFSEINKMSDDQISDLNKALFYTLAIPGVNGCVRDFMDPEDQAKFKVEKDGDKMVFSSTIFAKGAPVPVISSADGKIIADPEIPVKTWSLKKNPTSEQVESGKIVAFDILNPSEELEYLNPQNLPKYAKIANALGGLTFKEAASQILAKSKKVSNKSSATLSNERAMQLIFAKDSAEVKSTKFDDSGLGTLTDAIASKLY